MSRVSLRFYVVGHHTHSWYVHTSVRVRVPFAEGSFLRLPFNTQTGHGHGRVAVGITRPQKGYMQTAASLSAPLAFTFAPLV